MKSVMTAHMSVTIMVRIQKATWFWKSFSARLLSCGNKTLQVRAGTDAEDACVDDTSTHVTRITVNTYRSSTRNEKAFLLSAC